MVADKSKIYSACINYMKDNDLMKIIERDMHNLQGVMLIDKEGKILEYDLMEPFASEVHFDELKYIAKIISLRFHIIDFQKCLGGLEMTINIFRDHLIFVTSLNENILVTILPKTVDVVKTINIVSEKNKLPLSVSNFSQELVESGRSRAY